MPQIAETITVSPSGFDFPTSEILTGRGFITGKSGAGKSNSSNVVAEELLELGLPFVIVDIDGEYWGLKDQYAIERAGRGEDVDFQLTHEMVPDLVDLVLEDTTPLILDVSAIPEEETDEIVAAFVETLFERENDVRKPCLLFVEELHEFLPQRGGKDDLANLLIRVAKRGRKRGLGMCGMSQRPAAVDKDFITQCDWIVWHRLTWENDVSVVTQILGSEAAEQVQELETGQALVMTDWDEEITTVQFRKKRTFDAGATPDLSSFAPDELTTKRQSDDGASGNGSTSSSSSNGSSSTGSSRSASSSGSSSTSGSKSTASSTKSASNRSTTATTDGGGSTAEAEFDPVQEVALLAAHGVGGMVAFVMAGVRTLGAIPALTRRAVGGGAPSIELTEEHLGRRRDRWLQAAIVLLVLAGIALLGFAIALAFLT